MLFSAAVAKLSLKYSVRIHTTMFDFVELMFLKVQNSFII